MPHPGKMLEAVVRKIRPYTSPAYRRAFSALVARGLRQRRNGEPVVCCDFANPAIDAVGGRYYFSLVRDLIDASYFVAFTARRATLSTFGTSPMKSLLLDERLGVVPSLAALQEPYDLITDCADSPPHLARRVVVVDYQWRICQRPSEAAFPLFVHPKITPQLARSYPYDVAATRPIRVFFGGNTTQDKYDKDTIREVYGMLSRCDVLESACSAQPAADILRPRNAAAWLASPDCHPMVVCETQHCAIPRERWLDALAKADFFLACPGVGMPLCHNLMESIAVGCIPILQYAAYLTPSLQDGVNCLAFHDEASLRQVMTTVQSMSQEQIRTLRANVRQHYEKFLAPGRFAQKLLSDPHLRQTLLLNDYRVPR